MLSRMAVEDADVLGMVRVVRRRQRANDDHAAQAGGIIAGLLGNEALDFLEGAFEPLGEERSGQRVQVLPGEMERKGPRSRQA